MNTTIAHEVSNAYFDCWTDNWEYAQKRRNLNFRASGFVSRDEAFEIMSKYCPSYNDFSADLIIKEFPKNCMILIAREGSVCLYVMGNNLPKNIADEESIVNGTKIYWWD
jgi:hypothetical protein